jgi:hypothetical protein
LWSRIIQAFKNGEENFENDTFFNVQPVQLLHTGRDRVILSSFKDQPGCSVLYPLKFAKLYLRKAKV